MSQKHVAIVGHNNTQAQVTGQNELLVRVNSSEINIDYTDLLNTIIGYISPLIRRAQIERVTGAWSNVRPIYSFSVANVGTGNGECQGIVIKPGEVVNFDAGAIGNFFDVDTVSADGTDTELLITYIV